MPALWIVGCAADPEIDCLCVNWERADDFRGRLVHTMELEDGTRSPSVEAVWSHEGRSLVVYDREGGQQPRLAFPVEARVDLVDAPRSCCGYAWPTEPIARPPLMRTHMRVDWSREVATRAAGELLGPIQPETLTLWVVDDEDWERYYPRRERDTEGRLTRLELRFAYHRLGDDAVIRVRHVLELD